MNKESAYHVMGGQRHQDKTKSEEPVRQRTG
jgi:hypothetical protein